MVFMGNSQENHAVLPAPAIKASLLSSHYLVRKETPGFSLYSLDPPPVSVSARIMPKCFVRARDWPETPEVEDPRIDAMLPGSSGGAAKFGNPKVDWKETPEFEDPLIACILRRSFGIEAKYAKLLVDLMRTPEVEVIQVNLCNPKVDWKETPEFYLFEVDLPGLKKEQVKLEVGKSRTLRISGKWSAGKLEEDKNYTRHFNERSSGEFQRSFLLPENAKLDQIKATMGNGVLTVTVPKEEAMIIEISEDDANMDQNGVLSVKTIDKGKGVMGIGIGQVKQRRGFKLM